MVTLKKCKKVSKNLTLFTFSGTDDDHPTNPQHINLTPSREAFNIN